MEKDPNQNREAGDRESDDRNMIDGHVEMGRREEDVHGLLAG
jgi:hypothetical protein